MTALSDTTRDRLTELIRKDISEPPVEPETDPFWGSLARTGTAIWLDTGDIEAARSLWTREMKALTTNNSLLNREVQKGIYDDFIREVGEILKDLDPEDGVREVAFALNARHGLRLVEAFGGMVSVELHTDLSDDLDGILHYGQRFFDISPDHFLVKVPLTATGLLGTRMLRERGVRVNLTLGFSARQNALVTIFAKPNYCNVFLGRLGSFVAHHEIGDGENVGEKAALSSQRVVKALANGRQTPTKQIAASIREPEQLKRLAGVDVITMPPKVAGPAREQLSGEFTSQLETRLTIDVNPTVDQDTVRIEKLWQVEDELVDLAENLDEDPPHSGEAVVDRAIGYGFGELFPKLSDEDRTKIETDGKIPDHAYWKERVRREEIALDAMMNLGGLAAFTADQQKLDDRVRGLLSRA
ncbi:MAG: transaldolase family protein [Spirochaetota bacterium]